MSSNQQPGNLTRFAAFKKLVPIGRGKLPVMQQLTATDCGAVCLAMVLELHGKRLPLDEVRALVPAGRDGVNARRIVEGARRLGLRARGVTVALPKLRYLPRGSILHWEMNHFVVLDEVSADGIRIIDPAVGPRRIPFNEVDKAFTGVAILLEPDARFEASDTRPASRMERYKRWLLSVPGYWSRVIVMSALLQVIALAMPGIMGLTVDKIVPRHDQALLHLLAAGLLMVVSFHFLATFLRSHLLLHLRTYVDGRMSMEFLEHLLNLPYGFFQQRSTGDIVMRLSSGGQIRELLTSGAMSAVLDGTMVVFYFVLLVLAAPQLGFAALGLALVQVAVFWRVGKRNAELMAEQLARQARLSSFQVEMLAGIESVKSMGAEQRMVDRWSELYVDVLNTSLDKGRLGATFGTLMSSLNFLGPVVLVVLGAQMVLDGELTLGAMLALSALGSGFLSPINTLVSTAMQLETLKGYMSRIEDILDSPSERRPQLATGASGTPLSGQVELSDVSFRYGEHAPLVLEGVSLTVQPGQFVAVVGPSGSGKSTLARMLGGLYSPIAGDVAFDGIPLGKWDPPELRSRLGMVTQDTRLFAATIRDNIALLDRSIDLDDVVSAAELACVDRDIDALPMGYDTVLADGGASMSGGQRQRLALARALLHRPSVVVLDEATSALDSMTERRIQASLSQLSCTRIVIAHRLSTIRDADLILVLDQGREVGRGTHDELLAGCELYRELCNAQG